MTVNSLKRNDPDFPEVLRQIPSPPRQIFWLGADPNQLLSRPRVAVVGSRKISPYGQTVTAQLTEGLVLAGVVSISGLALGVDAVVHKTTLAAGGQTIAVLPTSLDQIYPATHLSLAKQIVDSGGCLISEYPPGSLVYRTNFIARNRLVSGFADALLITEAARDSGTMHTAGFALEQGKTVMAVPGNITSPTSEGCNNLIKNGAAPVTNAEDIFFAMGIKPAKKTTKVFRGDEKQQLIYELISSGISDIDSLAATSKLDGSSLSSSLTMLEINGYIRANAGSWTIK